MSLIKIVRWTFCATVFVYIREYFCWNAEWLMTNRQTLRRVHKMTFMVNAWTHMYIDGKYQSAGTVTNTPLPLSYQAPPLHAIPLNRGNMVNTSLICINTIIIITCFLLSICWISLIKSSPPTPSYFYKDKQGKVIKHCQHYFNYKTEFTSNLHGVFIISK